MQGSDAAATFCLSAGNAGFPRTGQEGQPITVPDFVSP
jgi:hypothetical protein